MRNIDVSIPYELGERLGHAYNVAAGRAEDWFLFLDHDLCLVNPWWYEICVRTIEQYGDKAGLISCYTNRIGNRLQIAPGVDTKSEDLAYHRAFARSLYNRNRGKVLDHTAEKMRYSGFFMLSAVVQAAISIELVPRELLGSWFGIVNLFRGVVNIASPLVGGFLWESLGPETVFYFLAATQIAKLLILASMPSKVTRG